MFQFDDAGCGRVAPSPCAARPPSRSGPIQIAARMLRGQAKATRATPRCRQERTCKSKLPGAFPFGFSRGAAASASVPAVPRRSKIRLSFASGNWIRLRHYRNTISREQRSDAAGSGSVPGGREKCRDDGRNRQGAAPGCSPRWSAERSQSDAALSRKG
jgi:hypothetical protein